VLVCQAKPHGLSLDVPGGFPLTHFMIFRSIGYVVEELFIPL
jgi:hypothetical protein